MPKVAYSEAEKAQVREALLTKGLELLGNTAYDCGTNLQGGRNLSHILLFFFFHKRVPHHRGTLPPAAKGSCIRTEIDGCSLFELARGCHTISLRLLLR